MENAKLLLTFFLIDTKTEDELNHARKQSAKLRGEIRKLKRELEAAKKEQEKIKQLQRENKQLKDKVTKKTLEFEKILTREQQIKRKLKNCLEKVQAEIKDKEVLLKNMRVENKRLHEESNAERSKCDALSEEVRRLKEMPGRKCFVQLFPHCTPRHQKRTFFWHFAIL